MKDERNFPILPRQELLNLAGMPPRTPWQPRENPPKGFGKSF